jgi:hypothetical protein
VDPLGGPVILLALAIASNAVVWFFKTPKETHRELVGRVDEIEDRHHALDKVVIGFMERVTGRLDRMADALEILAAAVEKRGFRITGDHAIAKRPRGE